MKAMQARRGAAAAFTLVELLVVIAVILILAALVMPALDRATRLANRTACISNCHQIYLTLTHYAQNFRNLLPTSSFEYTKITGSFDSVPALRPYVPDPRILYCTIENIGPLPDVDDLLWWGGSGWNRYGEPGAVHILSNIALFCNPDRPVGTYDDNLWAIGQQWRHPRAALVSHRRVMRFDLPWDPADWRCQNWYPHGDYHDVTYGDGRNETHSKVEWLRKPRLFMFWSPDDKCNIYY
jgi:prepilin-type N-terminal cleavage/methylation domain-containing protein